MGLERIWCPNVQPQPTKNAIDRNGSEEDLTFNYVEPWCIRWGSEKKLEPKGHFESEVKHWAVKDISNLNGNSNGIQK